MGYLDVFPTFLAHNGGRVFRVNGTCRVKVPVVFLCRRKQGYQFIQVLVQFRVGMQSQGIGCSFHDLEHVGIVEENPFMLSFHEPARLGKVADAARFLRFLKIGG